MEFSSVRKKLSDSITFEVFPVEEYQDKYYLLKKIKNIFPELPEQKITEAINFANSEVKSSGNKKKFINALSVKMFIS